MKRGFDHAIWFMTLIVLILMGGSPAMSQVIQGWVAQYNGPGSGIDMAKAVFVDADGTSYVTGFSLAAGTTTNYDYTTIKYTSDGVPFWDAHYNGPANLNDEAVDVAQDYATGNVYVTGYSQGGSTGSDIATVKYNANGQQQWAVRYNGAANGYDAAFALALDPAGNVYVTGSSQGNQYDYITLKYSPAGVLLWEARYNGPGNGMDEAFDIALDEAGNVYVTGYSDGSGSARDIATVKYNSSGVQQWVARYNGPGNQSDGGNALVVDGSGNVYVAGYSANPTINYDSDFTTLKYNSSGVQQWVQRFNGPPGSATDIAEDLALSPAGDVYVTGTSMQQPLTDNDYLTIKYNAAGELQWTANYNEVGSLEDIATAIAVDSSGNAYVTGYTQTSTGSDYATIKYASDGTQCWVITYDGPQNDADVARDIALGPGNSVFVTGESNGGPGIAYNFATVKYLQSLPLLDLELQLTAPPVYIPPGGGSFNFYASLTNYGSTTLTFDVWTMLHMPDWSWYGPVLGPLNLTMQAGANILRLRTQYVPGSAPPGLYTYFGYVGIYATSTKWDSANFCFIKQEQRDLGQGPDNLPFVANDWLNTGELFPYEIGGTHSSRSTSESGPKGRLCLATPTIGISPNPFNPTTALSYELRAASQVRLTVWDTAGRLVSTLAEGMQEAGQHSVTFDGSKLTSGVYLYRLSAGANTATGKMVLMR